LITSPFFPEIAITSPTTGKTSRIIAHGWDKEYENMYIQRATLNGKAYTKSWLDHSFFLEGGKLEVWLGKEESLGEGGWGTREEDRPPSLSTNGVNLEGLWLGT
jgi:putative alpha-1,2-mannosidase